MLLLDRLNVIDFGWGRIFWMFTGIWGAVITVQGFSIKRRGRVFWGSLLFFVAVVFLFDQWDYVWWSDAMILGGLSLALGLAFLMLFLFEPKNLAVLIPGLLFAGIGAVMVLVEFDYLSWWEVRRFIRDYWPVLLIVWGVAIVVRRRPRTLLNSKSNGGEANG
jgi:hypothetical protein